jgi:hypothetical protein
VNAWSRLPDYWRRAAPALAVLLLFGLVLFTHARRAPGGFKAWAPPPVARLNLSGWRLAYQEGFDRLDLARAGPARWFAPGHSDFGLGHFAPPEDSNVYRVQSQPGCRGGCLVLGATRDRAGGWRTTLVRSVDPAAKGAAFGLGYFEVRAKVPLSPASWPAIWLLTTNGLTDPTQTRGEIDVMEHYGESWFAYHASTHLWPANRPRPGAITRTQSAAIKIPRPDLALGFHRYGVMVGRRWITFYFDGWPVARHASSPVFASPKYLLLDLALTEIESERASPRSEFLVDEVRVFTPPPGWRDY